MKLELFYYRAVLLVILAFFLDLNNIQHCLWVYEGRDLFITRDFIKTGKLTYFGEPWLQHPFGFYWLLSLSFLIFGVNDFAGEIVVALLGALTGLFVYLLGKELFDKKTGLIAAVLILFQPIYWFYSNRVLNDVPVILFLTAAFYFFIRGEKRNDNRSLYISGFLFAYAMLTKMIAIAALPVVFFYLLLHKRLNFIREKKYWITLTIFIATFSIWLLYNQLTVGYLFPLELFLGRVTPGVHQLDTAPFSYFFVMFIPFLRLPLAILFFFGVGSMLLTKFRNASLLMLWITIFFTLASLQTVKVDRYIMPIFPAVAIVGGFGLSRIFKYLGSNKILAQVIVGLIVIMFFYVSFNEAVSMLTRASTSFCGLKETGDYIKSISSEDDTLIAASNTQVKWYSDRNLVPFIPNQSPQEFDEYVKNNSVDYIIVDIWERTAPSYIFNGTGLWQNFLNNPDYPLIYAYELSPQNYISFIYEVQSNT